MFRRDILSWWLRPAFLRPYAFWAKASDTLFAGPWAGEFGWELMQWQGFVRKLSRRYRRTVVCCPEGREALYTDFAETVVTHRLKGTSETNRMFDVANPDELARVEALVPEGCHHLKPLGYQPFARQEIIRFGTKKPELAVDVLFHPRGRGFGADRNWSVTNWETLLDTLRQRGLSLGCIGVSGATLKVAGEYRDLRDKPLSETLDVIASARVVIGPSSGPMHLASLCGTPHLVWTDRGRYARGLTNRDKYEWWWNPLKTPVHVLDAYDFNPSPATVAETLAHFLDGEKKASY